MKLFMLVSTFFACLLCNSQHLPHPQQLKNSIYFPCEYFSFIKFELQSNGNIIVCGSSGKDDDADLFLMRFLPDGKADKQFGKNGIIHIDLLGYKDIPVSLNILSDNKILVGAVADNAYSYRTMKNTVFLLRFNPDGTFDESFGESGKYADRQERRYKGLMASAVSENGATYLLRRYDFRDQFDFGITAIKPTGSRDSTFGSNGHVNGSFRKFDDNGMDITLQRDGKIVVTGQSHTRPSPVNADAGYYPADVFVARYNPDGTIDSDFGTGGRVLTSHGNAYTIPKCIAVSPSGNLFITGSAAHRKKQSTIFLYSYNPDGTVQNNFGGKGVLTLHYSTKDEGHNLCFQPDGKILLAGNSKRNNENNNFIARLLPGGAMDTSFAKTGRVMLPYISTHAMVKLKPDGKIILGSLATFDRRYYYVLSAFLPNGKPDPDFGKGR